MKCPRTGTQLKTIKVGGIEIEISESCGGAFFDNSELDKFKDPKSVRGSALVKHLRKFSSISLNEKERIKCPKCENVVMMRRYFSPLKVLEIDECPGCAGIWLDTGELSKLHDNHLSERELALLRAQMIDDIYIPKIDTTPHRYMRNDKNHLASIFEMTTYIIDDY
jgi:Zn-finger nucleic acid-binding protein